MAHLPGLSYGVFGTAWQAVHGGFPTLEDEWTACSQAVDGSHGGESESCAGLGLVPLELWMCKEDTHISESCVKLFTVRKVQGRAAIPIRVT